MHTKLDNFFKLVFLSHKVLLTNYDSNVSANVVLCKRMLWREKQQGTIHILLQQRGGRMGSEKWQFLLIYSFIYYDLGRWVGGPKKDQKYADVIYGWSQTENNFEFLREIMVVSIWGFVELAFAILFYLVFMYFCPFIYQRKVACLFHY